MNRYLLLTLLLLFTTSAYSQVGEVVTNVEVLDIDNNPTKLPHFAQKYLLIFYVDPDRAGQNDEFTEELRSNKSLNSDKLYGFTVLNLLDAPMVPNGLARSIARKRSEATGTTFLLDEKATLSSSWGLGECDNNTVIMIISPAAEILFLSKGRISDGDKAHFYEVLSSIK